MTDKHYTDKRLAELYDLDCGWSVERDFYVRFCGLTSNSILDVGCGTGLISRKLAMNGHHVVGVDPASAMLDTGRTQPGAEKVTWVESTLQTLALDQTFDRIIMTGNAFQVLHHENDLTCGLIAMREHLAPNGLIAFETRNPDLDWAATWDYDLELTIKGQTIMTRRRFLERSADFLTFELCYVFPEETLRSESVLRFWSVDEITSHVHLTGLAIEAMYGDWFEGSLKADSAEMIIVLRHADSDEATSS